MGFDTKECEDDDDCRAGYGCAAPGDVGARIVDLVDDVADKRICLVKGAAPTPPPPTPPEVCEASGSLRRSRRRDRFFCGSARKLSNRRPRSDCRLQPAEFRLREFQFPLVRVKDVLDNGKTQTGCPSSLVEAGAALEHA